MNDLIPALKPPRMHITITQAHIDKAKRATSSHCVVAEAIKDAFIEKYRRKAHYVAVDVQTIRITDPAEGLRYIYLTPRPAQNILLDFDQGRDPEPGTSFRLRDDGGHILRSG